MDAENEVAIPVATTYNKPNKQSLVPPEATQQFRHPPPFPIKVPEVKTRQTFQQIPGSTEATAHKYTFCGSFGANVKLCEISKRYLGTKKEDWESLKLLL